MRLPWVKWFPADWSSEPGLRLCSLSARGMWAEALNRMMLCGSDRVEGTLCQLSKMFSCDEQEISTNAQQLYEQDVAQVIQQNGNITLISRRRARELRIRQLRSEAGKLSATKRQQKAQQTAQHTSASAYAYASDSLVNKKKKRAENEEELVQYCVQRGLTENDGRWLWEKWEGNGWRNGGEPIVDYKKTIGQWKRQGDIFPSHKSCPNGQKQQQDDWISRDMKKTYEKLEGK